MAMCPMCSDSVVYSLDLGSLLAGTKYRGDFEKRFKGLLAELKKQKHAILFIDEVHTIIGAGAASGGVMDASNLLKPLLSSGDIRCIGSTTFQEYRGMFDKDRALSRRFQKIDVGEPSVAETVPDPQGPEARASRSTTGCATATKALQVAAELSNRYITDRFLPDKAIDVIDEAGAYQRLLPESRRKKVIGVKDVEDDRREDCAHPAAQRLDLGQGDAAQAGRRPEEVVFGQDEAMERWRPRSSCRVPA